MRWTSLTPWSKECRKLCCNKNAFLFSLTSNNSTKFKNGMNVMLETTTSECLCKLLRGVSYGPSRFKPKQCTYVEEPIKSQIIPDHSSYFSDSYCTFILIGFAKFENARKQKHQKLMRTGRKCVLTSNQGITVLFRWSNPKHFFWNYRLMDGITMFTPNTSARNSPRSTRFVLLDLS